MRRNFLSLNSQFDNNHPFNVPRPPPNKLVKKRSFKDPKISSRPERPNEKFPRKIKFKPSIRKLKIGINTIIATINAVI